MSTGRPAKDAGTAVIAAAVLVAAFLLVWHLLQLAKPFPFDYVEGMMLHGVNVAGCGDELYPKLDDLPVLITAYPPLYYYVVAAGNFVFGHSFFFGRLVSLLAAASTALAIALMVRRRVPHWAVGAAAAAAFYLTLPARNWAVLMRVDALEIALAVWGFYAAIFKNRRWLAAALFLAAFFTKHTMFAAPAAVLAAWWFSGRRRDAAALAAALAVVAGAVFVYYGWRTDGAFWIYLFAIHEDAFLPGKWIVELLQLARTIPVVLALATWFTFDAFRRDRFRADPAAWYFVMSLLSTLLGGKLASFWNHYLEFCAAAALVAGCAVGRLASDKPAWRSFLWGSLALQVVMVIPMMLPWKPGQWYHGASALALAGFAGWLAFRFVSARAAIFAALLTIVFPGVWHWGLMMLSIGPVLLSMIALALLLEGLAVPATLIALGASAWSASLLPIAVPVAWALLRGDRRRTGLLFIAACLAAAVATSPETNLFHSPKSLTLSTALIEQWVPAVLLLIMAASAAALAPASRLLSVYAAAALAFALVFRDAALWIAAAPALAALACAANDLRRIAWIALVAQLALLSPFPMWLRIPYDSDQLRYVYEVASRIPDPILSENVGLLAAARKPVLISDPYAWHLAVHSFREEPLLEKLRRREIRAVITSRDPTSPEFPSGDTDLVWSRGVVDTLLTHYRKTREFDTGVERFYFFEPRRD